MVIAKICNVRGFRTILKGINLKVNLFLVVAATLFFSSCTSSKMTISSGSFQSTVAGINSQIASVGDGYRLTGSNSETQRGITYDTYTFTDSKNNAIVYQLKYAKSYDRARKEFVYNVGVERCNCDDYNVFNTVCGFNGTVKKIEQLYPDQRSVFNSPGKTITAISLGLVGGALLIGGTIIAIAAAAEL